MEVSTGDLRPAQGNPGTIPMLGPSPTTPCQGRDEQAVSFTLGLGQGWAASSWATSSWAMLPHIPQLWLGLGVLPSWGNSGSWQCQLGVGTFTEPPPPIAQEQSGHARVWYMATVV